MTVMGTVTGLNKQMNDETIVNDILNMTKGAATAYLAATLEAATPELKTMYANSLSQILGAQASVTNLAVDKSWYRPYEAPEQQLADAFKQSVNVINYKK